MKEDVVVVLNEPELNLVVQALKMYTSYLQHQYNSGWIGPDDIERGISLQLRLSKESSSLMWLPYSSSNDGYKQE